MNFFSTRNYFGFPNSSTRVTQLGSRVVLFALSVRAWKIAAISICFIPLILLTESYEQEKEARQKFIPVLSAEPSVAHAEVQSYGENGQGVLQDIRYASIFIGPMYKKKKRNDNMDNIKLTTPELVKKAYPTFQVQRHHVTTKDNYTLTLFRIIDRNCRSKETYFPVLFQHGLMGSSDDFLLLDPEHSLRNEYSKSHEYLNTNDPRYWDFSFHEMGVYDLPVFEYIKRKAPPTIVGQNREKQNGLIYIGHGLGTTIFYVCLSKYPGEYNEYIKGVISFGPMAFLSMTRSPLQNLIPLIKHYQKFPKDGPVSFIAIKDYLYGVAPELCTVRIHGRGLCGPEIFTFLADTSSNIRKEMIPIILKYTPSSTSKKTLIHFLQLLDQDYFREFDYGPIKNFLRYNQTSPLVYDIFRVNVPAGNFYGSSDTLIGKRDAERTIDQLGTQLFKINAVYFGFNYAEFIYSERFLAAALQPILVFLQSILDGAVTVAPTAPGLEGTSPTLKNLTHHNNPSSCYCTSECVKDL